MTPRRWTDAAVARFVVLFERLRRDRPDPQAIEEALDAAFPPGKPAKTPVEASREVC